MMQQRSIQSMAAQQTGHMGYKTNNRYQRNNDDSQNGYGFSTMLAIGGLTALAFYMNSTKEAEMNLRL